MFKLRQKQVRDDPDSYWQNLLSSDFSLRGVGYWRKGKAYNSWMYKARKRAIERLIKTFPIETEGKRILDIGTGTGFYVDIWKEKKPGFIKGVDIAEVSIQELKKKYPQFEFEVQNISKPVTTNSETFDIIGLFDVLFHIIDDEKFNVAIQNIKTYSRKETLIILTDALGKVSVPPFGNCHTRSRETYERVLQENGIEILKVIPLFFFLNPPYSVINRRLTYFFYLLWEAMTLFTMIKPIGYLEGAFFYFLDGLLPKVFSTCPSTKILVGRYIG
jgi:SAM-dependent methyltransferase